MEQQQENIGLGQYLKKYFQQSLQVFKNPVKLLPTLVIGFIWIVIGILSSLWKPFPMPMQVLSFLSYAEGGLFGGVLGAVGGIIGKVVMAVFINSLILPLFEKKPPFVGVAGGLKGMFTSLSKDTASGVSPLLKGVGFALLAYAFMNINQRWQNSMVGIVALVLLLQDIGSKGGFFTGLLFSMANTLSKGRVPQYITITRFLTGMTLGMTMGVALSFAGLRWAFWISLFFLLVGFILDIVVKQQKKQAEALAKAQTAAPSAPMMPPPPPNGSASTPPPPPPINR